MSLSVDQALIQSTIDAGFGIDLAHENIEYTPTTGTPYAEVTVFDSGTEAWDLSDTDERLGVFQIVLNYPANSGAYNAKAKAEEIFNHFSLYSEHTYSGQTVRITSQDRGPGAPEEGWYRIRLRMNFRAHLPR